jgi:hypothetical protein
MDDPRDERIRELEAAIRLHRDQKGDDRCWIDDLSLYSVLPEGCANADLRLHTPEEMLANCKRFIASRQPDTEAYVSPQREIESLRASLASFEQDEHFVALKQLEKRHAYCSTTTRRGGTP